MDLWLIFALIALFVVFLGIGAFVYFYFFNEEQAGLSMGGHGNISGTKEYLRNDPTGKKYESFKKQQRVNVKKSKKKKKKDEVSLYSMAGMYTEEEVKQHEIKKILYPIMCGPMFGFLTHVLFENSVYSGIGVAVGIILGFMAPGSILKGKIKKRGREIMYYLPLVIEQISIGVSSSLDIGPCLQNVVEMADERDKHNEVTELVRRVQFFVRSGSSLDESLVEVATNSGHTELKHTFIALAQVSRHGGEISKQLMELANSVNSQRETKVDAEIKQLELKATGPVSLVFLH